MQQDQTLYNYSQLNNQVNEYFYSHLFNYFNFSISQSHAVFKYLIKENFRYLLFRNSDTHAISCLDLNTNQIISKSDLFFRHSYTLDFMLINQIFKNLPSLNEFDFQEEKLLAQVLTLFFQNYGTTHFPEGHQTFRSLISSALFARFITYHKQSKSFSFPLFCDEKFNAVNFLDFNESSYKPRFQTPFSIWYPADVNTAYSSEGEVNNLIISFNPLSLLNFFDPINNNLSDKNNLFPILLEPPLYFHKYLTYSNLLKPLQFEKIVLLYSSHPSFWLSDLLNHLRLIIFTINTTNPDFYFDINFLKSNSLTIFFHRYPKTFDVMEIGNLTNSLSDLVFRKFCGKDNPYYMNDMVSDNIKILQKHTFTYRKIKFDKKVSYYITVPIKIETLEFCIDYFIKKFLPKFSIEMFYGSTIFNDNPF